MKKLSSRLGLGLALVSPLFVVGCADGPFVGVDLGGEPGYYDDGPFYGDSYYGSGFYGRGYYNGGQYYHHGRDFHTNGGGASHTGFSRASVGGGGVSHANVAAVGGSHVGGGGHTGGGGHAGGGGGHGGGHGR